MNNISSVIDQVGILAFIMGIGLLAREKNLINDEISRGLSNILVNIGLPALVIKSFIVSFSNDLMSDIIRILIISTLFHVVIILFSKIILCKYSIDKQKILRFMFIFPNIGAMGIPLVYGMYGQIGVLYLSVFQIPYQILFWTYGERLFIHKKGINIRKYLSNPNIISVIIGFIIFALSIKVPFIVTEALGDIGSITMPLSMMIIGEKIYSLKFKEIILDKDVYVCSFTRLIIAPIIMFIILIFFKGTPLVDNICIAAEVIPTAIVSVIFCEKYNGNTILASKCILATHILSIITMPMMLMLLSYK